MGKTRREFLKASTVGGTALTLLGLEPTPAQAQLRELKIAGATQTRSTCPYCSVSCGVLIYTIGDKAKNVTPQVVHVEGDPDHPINRGTLCPKGVIPTCPFASAIRSPGNCVLQLWGVLSTGTLCSRQNLRGTRDPSPSQRIDNRLCALETPTRTSFLGSRCVAASPVLGSPYRFG
jgi:hypothetical protein